MGLGITAYKNLVMQEEGVGFEDGEGFESGDYIYFYLNPHFKQQAEHLNTKRTYLAEEKTNFRISSYLGYNQWRSELARLAGYGSAEHPTIKNHYGVNEETSGPFFELIYFSDCEGVIDAVTCKKLADDFEKFEEEFIKTKRVIPEEYQDYHGSYFMATYDKFKKAFKIGAENGAVTFN